MAVYRTVGPAEPIARKICDEIGSGPGVEKEPGTMSCILFHRIGFSVRYSGDVFRVTASAALQADIAMSIGKTSPEVTLVEFK